MPKKRNKELVCCQFFRWRLGVRNGVFYADGRNKVRDHGRRSLATRDRQQALERLARLDLVKAVELGLARWARF